MPETVTIKSLAETLNKAVALHRDGQKDAARAAYEKVLFHRKALGEGAGAPPQQATILKNIFAQSYNNLGIFLEEDKRLGEALSHFRKALDYSPGNVEALTNMARVYAKRKNFDGALEAAKKAVEINPKYVPAVIQLCRVCYNFGETQTALSALNNVGNELQTNPRLNVEYGRMLEKAGDFEGARKKLEKAVKLGPGTIYPLLNLANVNFRLNRFNQALENYREIMKIDPKHVEALAGMGYLLQNMGQLNDAMKCYQSALGENQNHHETLGFYASLLELMGRTEDALQMAERLLKMPRLPERAILTGGLTKAAAERKLGRFEDAIETLKTLKPHARNNPAKIQIHYGLAYAYDGLGQSGKAFAELEKANALFLDLNQALKGQAGELEELLENLLKADLKGLAGPKGPAGKKDGPVFVVGPLLGGSQALGGLLPFAPGTRVFEDTHVLQGIRRRLVKSGAGYPGGLSGLGEAEWEHLRGLYAEVNEKSVSKGQEGQVFEIDAMHILDVPLILKLFPGARFVFIGCDPRDSVLNAYFKDFPATRTTLNYADLETIARLYAKTMEVWEKFKKQLAPEVLEIRYEDLMKDPAKELLKVLKFAGHTDPKGAKKGFAAEAFFERASALENLYPPGRWQVYKPHLKAVMKTLEPFAKAQGYDA